jgi:hypothetical protein
MTRHTVVTPGVACLALALLAPACRPPSLDEAEEFRRGVPTGETVSAAVPTRAGQPLTVQEEVALRGRTAESYQLTRDVTVVINGGALFVGGLVRAVLRFPPTTLAGDEAVWGPWTGDLEPVTWRLTVTRIAEHQFRYRFDGQPRNQPSVPFVTVLSGTHSAAADAHGDPLEGFGSGEFTLDWDARAKLPAAKATEMGSAAYSYARLPGTVTTVEARFRQVLDEKSQKRVDVDYAYTHQPSGGGTMDFVDNASAQQGMPGGRWSVRSRWLATGAGRTDARASADTLAGALTASECWDTGFASTFLVHSWEPAAGYGNEAGDCAFTPAEYSKL